MNTKMPVLTQAVSALSLEAFLAEMDKGAKTLKWDALLVFDRGATNALLTQEYIDRVAIEEQFFPTLPDDEVAGGNGIYHLLRGLILDKPRLSFENASIQDSRAKLQMRLVGGKHMEVSQLYLDSKCVRSIRALSVYNAATRGLLDANIRLRAVAGSVRSNGEVVLDLKDAYDHQFSGGGTEIEKERLGVYFKEVFQAWSKKNETNTMFQISEMIVAEESPINPGVFGLRTHAAPGATVLGSEGYGDGAVVVFVAMKGSAPGTYPHDDAAMLYMLPDAAEPYTSNLVLSQKFLVDQIFRLGLEQLEFTKGRFAVEALAGDRYKLVAKSGFSASETVSLEKERTGGQGSEEWKNTLKLNHVEPVLFSTGDELVFEQRSLKGTFISNVPIGTVHAWWGGKWGTGTDLFTIHADVRVDVGFRFVISAVGESAKLVFELERFDFSAKFNIELGSGSDKDRWRDMAGEIENELSAILLPRYQARFEEFKNITFEIDALRLNNLLFRGENVVEPRDVALPTDLTLLGNLAPKRTTLVISPSEPIVASGQVVEFKADSAPGAVTWKVENLPGETGETGAFNNPTNGRYTAPSDDALRTEGHRRLIVTATSGQLVSRELISVVPSQVTVNPWTAAVNVGNGHSLTAGTPDSAALRWDTPALGTVGPDTDPMNPGGYKYTAPKALPRREQSDPQYYRALRLDPVTVQPAAGGAAATIDMLVVGTKDANYWLEPEAKNDGSVALPFYRINIDGDKVEVPDPVEWTVLRGSGTVDPDTRVYTPAPGADDQFVIIVAYWINDLSPGTLDYAILPLPFVPIPCPPEDLNPATEEV